MANFGAYIDEEFDLPKCAECDKGPFNDSRKEFGNRLALSGVVAGSASLASAIPLAVDGFSIGTSQLAKVAERAEKDELASKLNTASDRTDAAEYIKKAGDELFAEVDWEEVETEEGTKLLCYDCKPKEK